MLHCLCLVSQATIEFYPTLCNAKLRCLISYDKKCKKLTLPSVCFPCLFLLQCNYTMSSARVAALESLE